MYYKHPYKYCAFSINQQHLVTTKIHYIESVGEVTINVSQLNDWRFPSYDYI